MPRQHPAAASTVAPTRPATTEDTTSTPDLTKQLYRIPEAMEILSMTRSTIYEVIRAGRLRSVSEGSSRRITARAILEYVALLEREAAAEDVYGRAA